MSGIFDEITEQGLEMIVRLAEDEDIKKKVAKMAQQHNLNPEGMEVLTQAYKWNRYGEVTKTIYRNAGQYIPSEEEVLNNPKFRETKNGTASSPPTDNKSPSLMDYYNNDNVRINNSPFQPPKEEGTWWKESYDWLTGLFGK